MRLDAGVEASGPHDFAVRKITLSSAASSASIASQPYVRDDRETPLMSGGTGELVALICPVQPPLQKYFPSPPTQISSLSRAVPSHRGALRNVINAGRDAVDAVSMFDESC